MLNNIPLSEYTTVYLFIDLLKHTLVASRFLAVMNKAAKDLSASICVNISFQLLRANTRLSWWLSGIELAYQSRSCGFDHVYSREKHTSQTYSLGEHLSYKVTSKTARDKRKMC